jgi:hypothetical protein
MTQPRTVEPDEPNDPASDAFWASWIDEVQNWIRPRLRGGRFPNDLSRDILQDVVAGALEGARGSRAVGLAIRSVAEHCTNAIREERRRQALFPRSLDDQDLFARDTLWVDRLFFRYVLDQDRAGDEPETAGTTRQQMIQQAAALLRKRLTRRQLRLLELRYVVEAPGKGRPYSLKEIAYLWGMSYPATRQYASRTQREARKIAAAVFGTNGHGPLN